MRSSRARVCGLWVIVWMTWLAQPRLAAATTGVQPTRGSLLYDTHDPARPLAELPLQRTDVRVHVIGYVARVEVRQTFNNPFANPLEAIYVFPLPDDASVGAMFIEVGDQRIRSAIEPRAAAEKRYRKARDEGRLAALLDQERPNIFTQSVANIEPGKEVLVHIRYDVPLRVVGGDYEFVYPMVVGPRYIPGRARASKMGAGRSPDTDQVPDASRITPPVRKPGSPAGHNVNLEVTVDPGTRIGRIWSPTHKVKVDRATGAGPHAFKVTLPPSQRIPNKDFVVRYNLAATQPQATVAAQRDGEGGYLAVTVFPPAGASKLALPREVVFLVDSSSRMAGEPMALVKRALRHALDQLGPEDRFRLIRVDGSARALDAQALAPTPRNLRRATSWVNAIHAAGPTELMTGLASAFAGSRDPDRVRIVVLLSNGLVGNERAVLDAVSRHVDSRSRLYALGTGASTNRALLERAATLGRGVADYALLAEKPDDVIDRFFARIRAPIMTEVSLDWRGVAVREVSPAALPDLFAGQPLQVTARFTGAGKGQVIVRGKVQGKPVSYRAPVAIVPHDVGFAGAEGASDANLVAGAVHGSIARMWARSRIRELALRHQGDAASLERAVSRLALKHGLVTRYTSFVAIGEKVVDDNGTRRTFVVPVEMPEGISYEAVFHDLAFETTTTGSSSSKTKGGHDGAGVTGDAREVEDTAGGDFDDDADVVEAAPAADYRRALQGSALVESIVRADGRRWIYGVGVGFGVAHLGDERGALTGIDLQVGRGLARYWMLGAEVGVRVPLLDADNAAWSNLALQLRYGGLLGGGLHLIGGLGGALLSSGDLGLSYMGAIELQLPLPQRLGVGVQLRLDGAAVPDAPDPLGYGLGLRLSF